MAVHGMTRANAIKEGRVLLQTFGFNGFSFQDLAEKLGLRKQSLYVHFETKEDFALQLLEDYRQTSAAWFDTIKEFEPDQKLNAWFDRFYNFACEGFKYCPVNAFTGDYNSLPKSIQKSLADLADERRRWVESIVAEGQKKNIFHKNLPTKTLAELVVTLAYGAQQVARLSGDPERIKSVKKEALKLLEK